MNANKHRSNSFPMTFAENSTLFSLNKIDSIYCCFLLFYYFLNAFYSSGSFWPDNYFIGSNNSAISCAPYPQGHNSFIIFLFCHLMF